MKKMFPRMISLILTLVMCFGMLNITAFAAEGSGRFDCDCETAHTHGEECWEKRAKCGIEEGALICADEEHVHEESCYHAHVEECYEDVLICEKSVYHVHVKSCYANQSTWTGLKCAYANMKTHTHEYGCLTAAEKQRIVASYPALSHKVPTYSEPYVFGEMQTYLTSGYYFKNMSTGKLARPQLFVMGDLEGLEPGTSWTYEGGKRVEFGKSNYAVAYCCDLATSVKQYTMYRQINLEDAGYYDNATARKIRAVMMSGYPSLSLEEMRAELKAAGFEGAELVDEGDLVAAMQFAIWEFSNYNMDLDGYKYVYTYSSGKYPLLTAKWKVGDADRKLVDSAERMLRLKDYLVAKAESAPMSAPKSQIVVSKVEVANLIMTADENGTYTVDLQVKLNAKYDDSHEDTKITITAAAGEATDSVEANGDSVYALKLEGYTAGSDIVVTMSGTQHLPLGVYFYEPYAKEGQDVRTVSQNLVGLNAGVIPVGDTVTLKGTELASTGLVVKKVNETGKSLANAEFELVYVDDENTATTLGTYITDENGEVVIEGLMAGKSYYLTESKAPEGYDPITGKVKLEIGKDGKTIAFNLPDGTSCNDEADENYILTVVNCKTPYDLTVRKVLNGGEANAADEFTIVVTLDDTSINATYGDMEFVNGVATVTLKGGESKTATDLPSGIAYTVTEPDTKGYEVSYTNCTGILNADQTAIVTNNKYSNTPGSVIVTKTTTGAETPEDATFQLQKLNGLVWENIGEAVAYSAFVDGAYTFEDLEEGTYRVVESNAEVEGYTLETTYSENVVLTMMFAENGDASVSSGIFSVTNTYEEELIEIPDEDPPLADVPKTGDMILPFIGMAIVSGMGAIFVGKKKEDEE